MLTEDDEIIRAQDTPERMQLATSSLSLNDTTLVSRLEWRDDDLDDAATWVLTRLSKFKEKEFLQSSGRYHHHLRDLVDAIKFSLRCLFIQEFEVPYIYTYKRDYISYFNSEDMRTRLELLSQDDLWRVYTLGQKYSSFLDRRSALDSFYSRLGVTDEYFETELRRKLANVEMVADATEWLSLKRTDSNKKSNSQDLRFHDDIEDESQTKKHQRPSRSSAYEVAKRSVVSKLADASLLLCLSGIY
jgi:transcription elongation factor SPT6